MPALAEPGAYAALRAAILSLALMPGEMLSERRLEESIGASRTPIRAALMRLEGEGLVRRSGRAWQVAPIDLDELGAVMEFRETLERGVVALAVDRADDEQLAALAALVDAPPEEDEETGLRDGADFHVALAGLSGNPFLADAMRGVLTRLARTRWLEVRTPASRAQARAEHREIVAAVRSRDADRAADLVVAHNRGTRERLLSAIGRERQRLRGHGLSIVASGSARP